MDKPQGRVHIYKAGLAAALGLVICLLALSGCRKDDFDTSPDVVLTFSVDTLTFDTVFQGVGSATLSFKVYNHRDERIKISSVSVVDSCSNYDPFRINVDGAPGPVVPNVEIGPNDSAFVFVEVTIDSSLTCRALETGVIAFSVNGNTQYVPLVAYGLDAIFYTPTVFPINGLPPYTVIDSTVSVITWTADKPIVVYGYAVVDEGQKLVIEPGAQIYFHQGSGLWVYQGASIQVGELNADPVVFQGDRLEDFYAEQPGQWDRIWINEGSADNSFVNALIKNSFIGIQVEPLPFGDNSNSLSSNKLNLINVAIRNTSIAGIFSRNYRIRATNVLLSSGGQHLLAGTGAGEYVFRHCTFANNWSAATRQTPSLFLTNLTPIDETTVGIGNIVSSHFQNCIVYGNGINELDFDFDTDVANVDLSFDHTLIRMAQEDFEMLDPAYFGDGVHVGFSPGFVNFSGGDFRLTESAYVRGKGIALPGINYDLSGFPYANPPALGCLEYQPE